MPAISNITFAAAEPVRLAEFWAAVLGYEPLEVPEEVQRAVDADIEAGKLEAGAWAMLVPPDGVGPRLLFQRRPKTRTESIPIHLDIRIDDRETEIERLTSLGATFVETRGQTIGEFSETWSVLRDPEGNGFCINDGGFTAT
ncbi:MAG: hypothetical protein QOE36_1692 [Gaiellaceae bacterium]|nr:hypothetical protein [Gaiellaceae bacterium]